MCSIEGCTNRVVAWGLCDNHYRRMKRNGSPHIHKNKSWGKARTVRADSYIYITVDGKQVMEHRHVMEKKLGRKLLPEEIVHHYDGDRQNNDPDNLGLFPNNAEHSRQHGYERTTEQMEHMRSFRAKHETLKKED